MAQRERLAPAQLELVEARLDLARPRILPDEHAVEEHLRARLVRADREVGLRTLLQLAAELVEARHQPRREELVRELVLRGEPEDAAEALVGELLAVAAGEHVGEERLGLDVQRHPLGSRRQPLDLGDRRADLGLGRAELERADESEDRLELAANLLGRRRRVRAELLPRLRRGEEVLPELALERRGEDLGVREQRVVTAVADEDQPPLRPRRRRDRRQRERGESDPRLPGACSASSRTELRGVRRWRLAGHCPTP